MQPPSRSYLWHVSFAQKLHAKGILVELHRLVQVADPEHSVQDPTGVLRSKPGGGGGRHASAATASAEGEAQRRDRPPIADQDPYETRPGIQ